MEGADDLPPDDEGDAAGPAALLRAAAELIVDAAERGRTLDAAAALLQLIPTEDLEETVLEGEGGMPAVAGEEYPAATAALPALSSSLSLRTLRLQCTYLHPILRARARIIQL